MRRFCLAVMFLAWASPACWGWGAHGHRIITYIALDGLPQEAPEWLRDSAVRHRIAYQASEPDRWRGVRSDTLGHENNPDHYIDIDVLGQFGLTLETVPPLRNEYLRAMAISKHLHPEWVAPYDVTKDSERSKEWPGFLPHAIAEHYVKLRSSFTTLRVIESLGDPARAAQLGQARDNAVYHMGVLSHFVGDAAQPLHMTKHHHGWVGDNPAGYTIDYGFHAYIDSGVVNLHGLTYALVRPSTRFETAVNVTDPWKDVLAYLDRSFDCVEPLYILQKGGDLQREPGREFIIARMADAAAMLEALYWGAWTASEPTDEQAANFIKFDEFRPDLLP